MEGSEVLAGEGRRDPGGDKRVKALVWHKKSDS